MPSRRDFLLQGIAVTAGSFVPAARAGTREPVRLAIYGLVHDHAAYMIPRLLASSDVQIVGIVEPDAGLTRRYSDQFHLGRDLFAPTLDALLAGKRVQAAATFTSTFDHRAVVEKCAKNGIHVMMEKPLAVNRAHAQAIASAAAKGSIEVIVNYDTSWYPSTRSALKFVLEEQRLGDIRKVVLRDGHGGLGPHTSPEFLAWLTDPKLNGGGAVMDFGCYGANLLTVLMRNQRPKAVLALTQSFRPDRYPRVDDEATMVVAYPAAVGIIQASWNWPRDHKDMDIYGSRGEVSVIDRQTLVYRESEESLVHRKGAPLSHEDRRDVPIPAPEPTGPNASEIAYFAAVVRREINPSGSSSLETNLIATEILDAARESARTGRRIDLSPGYDT